MKSKLNKSQITKLLTIKNSYQEDIYGIIGRMEVLLDLFKNDSKYESLVPFLETYYLVTRAVADKRTEYQGFFKDEKSLDNLDVYFASLYFEPLKAYLLDQKYQAPWKTYFQYCELEGKHPFVQMLLGINAHINADLTVCLVKLKYNHKHDFLIINKILNEVTPQVMSFLAFHEHDLYGLGAMIFKKFVQEEFHKTIVNWRKLSWQNAQQIKNLRQGRRILNKKTEDLGSSVSHTFDNLIHYKTLSAFTNHLNKLKVRF